MKREVKIIAREHQIKLIDNILCSLCSVELNSDGRKYLKGMKKKFQSELEQLRNVEEEPALDTAVEPFRGFRYRLLNSLKTPW